MRLLNQSDCRYVLDYSRPVQVYRNLHRACWSVRQDGLVKAYTDIVHLTDARFVVNDKGRDRVVLTKSKGVHAWLKGIIHPKPERVRAFGDERWRRVVYNPYKNKQFTLAKGSKPITKADRAWMILPHVWAETKYYE